MIQRARRVAKVDRPRAPGGGGCHAGLTGPAEPPNSCAVKSVVVQAGQTSQIGQSPPRAEGRAKVTGAARYVDDLQSADLPELPELGAGLLHGVTVRSPAPRGRI